MARSVPPTKLRSAPDRPSWASGSWKTPRPSSAVRLMWLWHEFPAQSVTRAERDMAADLLPEDGPTAASWAVATMELGATVCMAAAPRCADCPVADLCAWREAGYPAYDGPPRRGQTYDGTDRQCRGRLLAVLRDSDAPVHRVRLDEAWPAEDQRDRCLASLLHDGLVTQVSEDTFALP